MPIPWNGVVVIGHSFFSKLVFDIKDLFHALVASFLLLLLQGDNNITHVMCPTWLLTRSSGLWKHPASLSFASLPQKQASKPTPSHVFGDPSRCRNACLINHHQSNVKELVFINSNTTRLALLQGPTYVWLFLRSIANHFMMISGMSNTFRPPLTVLRARHPQFSLFG